MRKLLLASAAIVGATGGVAFAQSSSPPMNPNQGQMAAPWAAGGYTTNNNNNTAAAASKGAIMTPTPGTVVIRLNGKVDTAVTASWGTGDNVLGAKLNPIGFNAFMRLYPGVDGMATNGMRYGAAIELRENFAAANTTGNVAPGVNTQATAVSASGYNNSQTVYVRRAYVYVASDKAGLVRFGTTDGLIGLFDGGTTTSQLWDYGIGQFNGGEAQVAGATAGSAIPFVWLSGAGAEYDNSKVVYMTPQFAGFDIGVQYAPNMANSNGGFCNAAGATCINQSAGADPTRWINQVAAGVRYQGKFGGVAVKAFGVYETAGKESIAGGGYAANGVLGNVASGGVISAPKGGGAAVGSALVAGTGQLGAGAAGLKYDNLSFFNAGAAVTFSGLTFAANYIGGALNGQLAMRPSGGAPENAVLVGMTYANGPWTLGLESGIVDSQGDARLTKISQRHEWEIALGGTYVLAPGVGLVAEYIHTERHQGNFNFVTGAAGAGTRDAHAQTLLFATVVNW
jgi:hypothetical protein